jgi:hypothetical protein
MFLDVVQAQNTTITSLPSLTTHALTGSDDGPLVVALDPSVSPRLVHLSLSLCAVPSSAFAIYVTNSTKIDVPSTADFPSERRSKHKQAGAGIWLVALEYGFANWTGVVGEGGLRIAFEGGGGAGSDVEVEVAISESGKSWFAGLLCVCPGACTYSSLTRHRRFSCCPG